MLSRATQTNEPARCTALLPVLALIDGPLALIEVGTSAGLCLYPDRYSYEYDGRAVGPRRSVHLRCTTSGDVPIPDELPQVVARIGVDLNPLDVTDADDLAWLRALVWPGQREADRLARLDAAAAVAAQDPPTLLAGDLVDRLADALALVPDGATPVVMHTGAPALRDPRAQGRLRRAGARAALPLDRAGRRRHGAEHGAVVPGRLGAVLRALARRAAAGAHRSARRSDRLARRRDLTLTQSAASGGSGSIPRASRACSIAVADLRTTATRA